VGSPTCSLFYDDMRDALLSYRPGAHRRAVRPSRDLAACKVVAADWSCASCLFSCSRSARAGPPLPDSETDPTLASVRWSLRRRLRSCSSLSACRYCIVRVDGAWLAWFEC
jgi:hypothetical protein